MLSFDTVACDWSLAQKLHTTAGTEVYRFQRLRLADDKPVMIETSYIPKARFAGFTGEMLEQHAMYDIFAHDYGVEFTYAEEKFQAVMTDDRTAKFLNVKKSLPSLKIERFTYERELVIEYTVSMARGDQMIYSIRLNK